MKLIEFEIKLSQKEVLGYAVDVSVTLPEGSGETSHAKGQAFFDLNEFSKLQSGNPNSYSNLLGTTLFAEEKIRDSFADAKAACKAAGAGMRVVVSILPSAASLHGLRWELLPDPQDRQLLIRSDGVAFFRHLSEENSEPIHLRAQCARRVLVALSAPGNSEQFRLPVPDVKAELKRIASELGDIEQTVLGQETPLTLNLLIDALEERVYDALFLLCPAKLTKKGLQLFMEQDYGKGARVVLAEELNTRLKELPILPSLVVLKPFLEGKGVNPASISAQAGALSALAPQLADAGIPAVLAIQDCIDRKTATSFFKEFFSELYREGSAERAMSVARKAVRQKSDIWAPALFLRLKTIPLWRKPHFGGIEPEKEDEQWKEVADQIRQQKCTAILGPETTGNLVGGAKKLMRQLVEEYRGELPLSTHEDLPQIAQWIEHHAAESSSQAVLKKWKDLFKNELLARYSSKVSLTPSALLENILHAVGDFENQQPTAVYRCLAELPLAIYINTNDDELLSRALAAAKREPVAKTCPWTDALAIRHIKNEEHPNAASRSRPSAQCPLVYHLFGQSQESVVLTEDDFFRFLIGTVQNHDLIPIYIRRAFADHLLLIIGFQLESWKLRTLLNLFRRNEKQLKLGHVVIQLDPAQNQNVTSTQVLGYLEKYFSPQNTHLFWGSVDDFVSSLSQRLKNQ